MGLIFTAVSIFIMADITLEAAVSIGLSCNVTSLEIVCIRPVYGCSTLFMCLVILGKWLLGFPVLIPNPTDEHSSYFEQLWEFGFHNLSLRHWAEVIPTTISPLSFSHTAGVRAARRRLLPHPRGKLQPPKFTGWIKTCCLLSGTPEYCTMRTRKKFSLRRNDVTGMRECQLTHFLHYHEMLNMQKKMGRWALKWEDPEYPWGTWLEWNLPNPGNLLAGEEDV